MRESTRRALGVVVAAACAFALVLGGAALYAHLTRPGTLTAAVGTQAIVARPAPAVAPAPVDATGECASAMDAVRAIQHRFASGSLLDDAANVKLTADLAHLDRQCDPATAREFRARELTPWLTYLPPRSSR